MHHRWRGFRITAGTLKFLKVIVQLSTAVRSTKKKRHRRGLRSVLTMNMELKNEIST